jgi:hypothetical protein
MQNKTRWESLKTDGEQVVDKLRKADAAMVEDCTIKVERGVRHPATRPKATRPRDPPEKAGKGERHENRHRTAGHTVRRAARWWLAGLGVTVATYSACVAAAFLRYSHTAPAGPDEADDLLDQFMPACDVVERHHLRVEAPAAVTFAAAGEMDLFRPWPIRAIFRAREWAMGASAGTAPATQTLLQLTKSIGWGVLAERPGETIVMGAVTQPWLANVVFRSLPPAEFAAFNEPGYVKIAWTLRADPDGPWRSLFRTETRVVATDAGARAKFRWYWAWASPGIIVIRRLMLRPLRSEAERRERDLRCMAANGRTC